MPRSPAVTLAVIILLAAGAAWLPAQVADNDPPPPGDLPGFWRSTLEDVFLALVGGSGERASPDWLR